MPKVTALMPLFNGKRFIRESLESIQRQTFTDWEFIIVNDFGSDDGCADVVRKYAQKDNRIILLQMDERLGIAGSLNVGLDAARGEYIARVDVDDPSEPERFEKQVAYMDAHPEVSLCSCFCISLSKNGTHLEKVACAPEELKAAMLFPNEIRHFGAMLRKSYFNEHDLQYNADYIVEDYELWTRALIGGATFANIPEVLVTHRWGFGNISIAKGSKLEEEARGISARILESIGVQAGKYSPELLSGWRALPIKFAKSNMASFLQQGYQLIEEVYKNNRSSNYCEDQALRKILFYRWNWIRRSCGLEFADRKYEEFQGIRTMPEVSVVLPTFCAAYDISRAIDCVQAQTFIDWELLVVNDYGSDDGTAEIVRMYAWSDPRIRLIQAEEKLGLADSLNLGMRQARGKYIARLDADDTSKPERFAKQIKFLETHPEVGICGTWQHHYGMNADWVHEAATDPKVQKCRLLFWCDLCHSTLMLRRDMFLDNQLFYDPDAQAEDFELWTRAMDYMEIANLPEVLGEYHEGIGVTSNKVQLLAEESGQITASTLRRIFGMELPVYESYLLNGWINPISKSEKRQEELGCLRRILTSIWEENKRVKYFDSKVLLEVLAAKWQWAKNDADYTYNGYKKIWCIEDAFDDQYKPSLLERYQTFRKHNPQFSVRAKKLTKRIFRPVAHIVRRVTKSLLKDCIEEINRGVEGWTWQRYQRIREELLPQIDKSVERWTWERFQRVDHSLRQNFQTHYTPYYCNSKIRVVFLFQVASFWPGQESLYRSLSIDERFDVRLVCYDEPYDRTIKTETSRKYLEGANYDFVPWEEFDLADFNPHIAFLQTAYDSNRRNDYKSLTLFLQGIRVVYISYGIEISNTEHAHKDHFRNYVVRNSWKIYTGSEMTRQDYLRYLRQERDVCALGLPRFDALYHRENFQQLAEVKQRANGRKVVLWKVHFPKVIPEMGKIVMVTPYIREYIAFAKKLDQYKDLFFVFMPHPRFKEFNEDIAVKQELACLYSILEKADNVYIDDRDDYRNSLMNADCIIVDRSAVMVEAGCVGVPVLYMYNPDYKEPMANGIESLLESYYQGETCGDIEKFINMFRKGEDPLKARREAAFAECIPYFDGRCGERIKEDIIQSLERELEPTIQEQIAAQNVWLAEQNAQLEAHIDRLERDVTARVDKSVERWTWERYTRSKSDNLSQTWNILWGVDPDKMKSLVSSSATYDLSFYWNNQYNSINSAQRVLHLLLGNLDHQSVVDFGCGIGTWLWVAQAFGAQEILGIDGEYVPRSLLLIPQDCFLAADLEHPITLARQFDLAMSLEVAEHLSPEAADGFVDSLCNASEVILFSAAQPGQNGDGHINEQPLEYWIEKFNTHAYRPIEIKQHFKNDAGIASWYRNNLILFVHRGRYKDINEQINKMGI